MPLSLNSITRSLKQRNFRLFFFGQLVSLTGSWISIIATSWLVYRLTGSAVLLATLNAVGMLPSILISPIAGVHIDRWNIRKVLLVTQTASMLQSFTLALLTLADLITVPQLFILVAFQGAVNAFDLPARQSFIGDIVPSHEDRSNAIALSSAIMNGTRLIGPAIGGIIISLSNEGVCFLLDGFSYIAVVIALSMLKLESTHEPSDRRSVKRELLDGLSYATRFKPIGALILLVGVGSFAVTPYITLLPVVTKDIMNAGPRTLGFLMASSGLGAFSGAIYLASRSTVVGLGVIIARAGFALGLLLIVLAMWPVLWLAMPVIFCIGLSMVLLMSSSNAVIQTLVDRTKRGRILSLYSVAFTGVIPLGNLFAGWGAHLIGVRGVIGAGGIAIFVATGVFGAWLPKLREQAMPVYRERGIIPADPVAVPPS